MSPSEIRSERDALRLDRTLWDGRNHWMLVNHNGGVTITAQRNGEKSTGTVTIPRRTFAAMLDWYFKAQAEAPRD